MRALSLRHSSPRFIPEWERDKFWTVMCDGVGVGTIVEHQTAAGVLPPWHWTLHVHAGRFANGAREVTVLEGSGQTRDDCLIPFRQAFERYLEFIGPEGWQHHLEHMAFVKAPRGNWAPDEPGTPADPTR